MHGWKKKAQKIDFKRISQRNKRKCYRIPPLHKIQNNGWAITKCVKGKSIEVDNRYIVPCNPFLLLYFHAHINVETCASDHCIKYIHKSVYKDHDCANAQVTAEGDVLLYDAVSHFRNTRYEISC